MSTSLVPGLQAGIATAGFHMGAGDWNTGLVFVCECFASLAYCESLTHRLEFLLSVLPREHVCLNTPQSPGSQSLPFYSALFLVFLLAWPFQESLAGSGQKELHFYLLSIPPPIFVT